VLWCLVIVAGYWTVKYDPTARFGSDDED